MTTSTTSSSSTTIKQNVRAVITSTLSQYFANTLNKEKDIVNIVMAICQKESSFNLSAKGGELNPYTSSIAKDYSNSTPIINLLSGTDYSKQNNIVDGRHAWGLMQSLGLNHLAGCSKKSGKTEIEANRPDLVGQLVFPPGTALKPLLNGSATIGLQILAGLVILEDKWKQNRTTYSSRLASAVGGYLGVGSDLVTGQSNTGYVADIMYGSSYKLANNSNTGGSDNGSNSSTLTIASGSTQYPVGC